MPRILSRLQEHFAPLVERSNPCVIPDVAVLYNAYDYDAPQTSLLTPIYKPDTLTVSLTVDILDEPKPGVAVVTQRFFRMESGPSQFLFGRPHVIAFPLDASDEEIAKKVTYFIDHLPFYLQTKNAGN